MVKKITIAIDAMGGENAPEKTIDGVKLFLKKNQTHDEGADTFHNETSDCVVAEKCRKG